MKHPTKIHSVYRGFFLFGGVLSVLILSTRMLVSGHVVPLWCNAGISFGVVIPPSIFFLLWVGIIGYMLRLWYRVRHARLRQQLPYILIFAGALSNVLDRILYGCVIDYIHIVAWNVFNLADTCIVIGAIMIIGTILKPTEHHDKGKYL